MMGACFTARPGGNAAMIGLLVDHGANPNPPVKTDKHPNGRLLDFIQEQLADENGRRLAPAADVIVALTRAAARYDDRNAQREWLLAKTWVTSDDGAAVADDGTTIYSHSPTPTGILDGAARMEADGVAPVWVPADAGMVVLVATRPGFAPTFAGPFAPPLSEALKAPSLKLTRGFKASVLLVNPAGKPVPGAKVEAYYSGPPLIDKTKASGLEATTDSAGVATFEHVGAAPLNLVYRNGHGSTLQVMSAPLDPQKPFRWEIYPGE